MKEHFIMCFTVETVDGSFVQADRKGMCFITAVLLSIEMKENVLINLFQKKKYKKLFVQN